MEIKDFITSTPLYSELSFPENADEKEKLSLIYELVYGITPFDMYCTECGSHSIFRNSGNGYSGSVYSNNGRSYVKFPDHEGIIRFRCSRNNTHSMSVAYKLVGLSVIKIGQFPSLADLLTPDLKKYKAALGAELVAEWSRAIGLSAHGIGAGSFVYLRRIIESLIEEAHKMASVAELWDEDQFRSCRYSEKIQMLSGFLPEFMVKNKSAYGILSKGVHELSEAQCLSYFDVLSSAIELIAEEKLAKKEIEKKKMIFKKQYQRLPPNYNVYS